MAGVKKAEMTVEWAAERLDHDIKTAHERYERRLREIAEREPKPTDDERRASQRTRHLHAMEMRKAGKTYREIGDELGVTPGRASQIVAKAERMVRRGVW